MGRRLIAADLFAGAGGLAEGLESVGIRVAFASELHPHAALTHAFNHPLTRVVFGDARKLAAGLLRRMASEATGSDAIDLIVGGPPCQGFSTVGKKDREDPRNGLFREFARLVGDVRPRMFVLENVPGFKPMYGGAIFDAAVELFGSMGYELQHELLNAADYGVPQARQRFILVGRLVGETDRFDWPEPTHGPHRPVRHQTAWDALEDIAFLDCGLEAHRHVGVPQSAYQAARRAHTDLLFNHLATSHRADVREAFGRLAEGRTSSSLPAELRSGKLMTTRIDRRAPSRTVMTSPDDMIHYGIDRIPTVREMARLQSFDDGYVFLGKRTTGADDRRSDVPQYTQVGNAVPPLLGRALGFSLLRALGGEPEDGRHLASRQARHRWVRGSSGFCGYSLAPEALGAIALFDADGNPAPLPVSESHTPVGDAEAVVRWKRPASSPTSRPQEDRT